MTRTERIARQKMIFDSIDELKVERSMSTLKSIYDMLDKYDEYVDKYEDEELKYMTEILTTNCLEELKLQRTIHNLRIVDKLLDDSRTHVAYVIVEDALRQYDFHMVTIEDITDSAMNTETKIPLIKKLQAYTKLPLKSANVLGESIRSKISIVV